MMKRIQVIAVLMLSAVCSTVLADTWVYHDTLPTQVQVYVDLSSVNTISTNPLIKTATVSLGRAGEESETITIQAACAVKGIRTSRESAFSLTQPGHSMNRLVATVCGK